MDPLGSSTGPPIRVLNEQPAKTDSVVITAKRLDSDELSEATVEVETPASELALRKLLTELVGARHPDAELRSFANGAATFLAPKLLVVAVHRLSGGDDFAAEKDDDSQQQLFVA